MRTDSLNKVEVPETSTHPKEAMKLVRKSLHPLQVAAGDKENLVGAGRMPSVVSEKDINNKLQHVSPKKDKKKTSKIQEKKTVTVEDLTSEDGPSGHYWERLAETRRKALEATLVENQQLHDKVAQLSEENTKYKELLAHAQEIIDTLNEVLTEMQNGEDNEENHEETRRP